MSRDTTEAFRAEFRAGVPADYSGIRHAATALLVGLLAIAACTALLTSPLGWLEWAVVPTTIVAWNFVEWSVHKLILHTPRRHPILHALYKRHAGTHHRFFTDEHAAFEGSRDLAIVLFPVFALPAVLLLASPAALLAWLVLSANAALLLLATLAAMYILFEVMHFCAHVPENAFVRHCPLVNTMRRHHIAHHDPARMATTNMTFTLPLADWLLGTSDVRRGLLGTIFNGTSTRHVVAPSGRAGPLASTENPAVRPPDR